MLLNSVFLLNSKVFSLIFPTRNQKLKIPD
jgi:hypothetical protein